jgi:hypothetical protein
MHIPSHIWLTLTLLPWKRTLLVLSRPLLVTENLTTMKSIWPVKLISTKSTFRIWASSVRAEDGVHWYSYEHDSEPLGSIKGGDFFTYYCVNVQYSPCALLPFEWHVTAFDDQQSLALGLCCSSSWLSFVPPRSSEPSLWAVAWDHVASWSIQNIFAWGWNWFLWLWTNY